MPAPPLEPIDGHRLDQIELGQLLGHVKDGIQDDPELSSSFARIERHILSMAGTDTMTRWVADTSTAIQLVAEGFESLAPIVREWHQHNKKTDQWHTSLRASLPLIRDVLIATVAAAWGAEYVLGIIGVAP